MSASAAGPETPRPQAVDSGHDGAPGRRLVSLSVLFVAAILLFGLLPLWVLLGAGWDLLRALTGRPLRFAAARCALFLTLVAGCEVYGVLAAALLWLRRGSHDTASWEEAHYALQRRWADLIIGGTVALYGMKVEISGEDALDGRPMLLLMRHVSAGDGLLAVRYINSAYGYRLRFVVKRELLWDPCLDIVGGRIPNAFVRRDGTDSAREVARVRALARGLGRREGVIVFPEGTRFTPARRDRTLARLEEEGRIALLERACALRRSLPLRPGGVLGLLAEAPDLDVVLCAHTGLEEGTRLYNFVDGGLVRQTVALRFWRFPAADLPRDPEARLAWLYDRWAELDAWVDARLSGHATG